MYQAILGIGSAILGGIGASQSAAAQRQAANRQYEQDLQAYKFRKKGIKADYRHNKDQWQMNIRNDETLSSYRDETNLNDWNYSVKIKGEEYAQQLKQYAKSEQIYGQQLTFNRMAAESARAAEYRKLEDATNELAYQNQDIVIKALQGEGALAAKGQVGKSADKGMSAEFASLGRNQAILYDSLISAKADTSAAIEKIASDKFGADIAAQAARMLEPTRGSDPPKPLTTPRTEYLAPRKPKNYDFGPKPIRGAAPSSAGAWIGAASQGIGSIAGALTKTNGKYTLN